MEVTKKNFRIVFPEVKKAIEDSSFLAIDGEFTGVGNSSTHIHGMDTPSERYHKLRKGAVDFLLTQFGLSTFQYDQDQSKYIVKTFNFYIFPRPFSRQAPDIRFLCQSSSVDFLVGQKFDFNKVFYEGISYLSPIDEQKIKENLLQKHEATQMASSPAFTSPAPEPQLLKGPIQIPIEHKPFIEDICTQVQEFVEKEDNNELHLKPCNGFLRKLVYQTLGQRYPSGLHLESKTDEQKNRYIVVSKVKNEQDLKDRQKQMQANELKELDDAVGFTKVVELMSKSGKMIIGHNMILDLLHVVSKFRAPLPDDYEEFKLLVCCIFPRLCDTKLMASTQPFKEHIANTSLQELTNALKSNPFKIPQLESAEGFPEYTLDDDKLHEAGYDAFITGLAFATMANHLGTFQKPVKDVVLPESQLLEPFKNKIFLMKVYDIPYLNLTGPDLTPTRDHVFHLLFPAEWKTSDITNLFSAFGSVQIIWLDDVSAFIVLRQSDQAEYVMKTIGHGDSYRIQSYMDFKRRRSLSGSLETLKRKLPNADVARSLKRRSSLEEVPQKGPKYSISPIKEEDENLASPLLTEDPFTNGAKSKVKSDECSSPPKKKRPRIDESNTGSKAAKVFEEPDAW